MDEETSDFILYTHQGGKPGVALYVRDGNVWLNQAQLAQVFGSTKQNIGQHIATILEEGELDENSVVKYYFTTASDGKNYKVAHYSLEMARSTKNLIKNERLPKPNQST